MNPYLYLITAIVLEVGGTTLLTLSEGFTKLVFGIVSLVLYGLSMFALSKALTAINIGVAFTRFLVPEDRLGEVTVLLKTEAEKYVVGEPWDENTMVGPLISRSAFDKVRSYIQSGLEEGAELITGEVPAGPDGGYFVKPAVFTGVTPDMKIAREEIFGPVISVITYKTVDEAVSIANGTDYGLAGCVFGSEEAAMPVLRKIRAGYLLLNGNIPDSSAAFGGYKASGIGREYGIHGFEEFLEIKVIGV